MEHCFANNILQFAETGGEAARPGCGQQAEGSLTFSPSCLPPARRRTEQEGRRSFRVRVPKPMCVQHWVTTPGLHELPGLHVGTDPGAAAAAATKVAEETLPVLSALSL